MFEPPSIEINRVALKVNRSLTLNPLQKLFKAVEALECTRLAFSILICGMSVTLCIRAC